MFVSTGVFGLVHPSENADPSTPGHHDRTEQAIRVARIARSAGSVTIRAGPLLLFAFKDGLPRLMSQVGDDREIVPRKRGGRLELVTVLVGPHEADLIERAIIIRLILEHAG